MLLLACTNVSQDAYLEAGSSLDALQPRQEVFVVSVPGLCLLAGSIGGMRGIIVDASTYHFYQ